MYFLFLKKQAEIAAQGITLSCICPGFTDTAFVQNLEDKIPDFSTAHKAIETIGLLKYVQACIGHLCGNLLFLKLAQVVKILIFSPLI